MINGFKKPPIVETEVAYVKPTAEEEPAVTTEVCVPLLLAITAWSCQARDENFFEYNTRTQI